jgi:hypothetical protein
MDVGAVFRLQRLQSDSPDFRVTRDPLFDLCRSIADSWRSADWDSLLFLLRDFHRATSDSSFGTMPRSFYQFPMSGILLFCLQSADEFRAISLGIFSRIIRFLVLEHPFVNLLIEKLTMIVNSQDLDSFEPSIVCLKKLAKRSQQFVDLITGRVPYSSMLDMCEGIELSTSQVHAMVNLLVFFRFAFTRTSDLGKGTLNRSVEFCVGCPVMDPFDRIRYLWWLLICDWTSFGLFEDGWVFFFISSCLGEPPPTQEFVLQILIVILDRTHKLFDFDWEAVFGLVAVPELTAAVIGVMESIAGASGIEFLVEHQFPELARELCLRDVPFKVKKGTVAALAKFLRGCGRERMAEFVDEEVVGELIESLTIEDVGFQRELYQLFRLILQDKEDGIAQAFIDVFHRVGGVASNAELMDDENTEIANLATEFRFDFLIEEDEPLEPDWGAE